MFDQRETALLNYYSAERRAGATPLDAQERTDIYAERLDALYAMQLALVHDSMVEKAS